MILLLLAADFITILIVGLAQSYLYYYPLNLANNGNMYSVIHYCHFLLFLCLFKAIYYFIPYIILFAPTHILLSRLKSKTLQLVAVYSIMFVLSTAILYFVLPEMDLPLFITYVLGNRRVLLVTAILSPILLYRLPFFKKLYTSIEFIKHKKTIH